MHNSSSMPDSPRILHLYTLKFPQGSHEAFLDPELPILAKSFDEVKIFPWERIGESLGKLPANVEVIFTGEGPKEEVGVMERLRWIGGNLRVSAYRKKLRYNLANLKHVLARKEELKALLRGQDKVTHYSYWFDQWAAVLGMLSKEGVIGKYVSRAHNFDLYDYRHSLGYHPYRAIQLNGLSKVFPCSDMGADYLQERLPTAPIERAYLGTEDHGLGPSTDDSELRLISVARVVPLKQIDRIIEVLNLCKSKVHWTHAGDGPELENIRRAAKELPSNIETNILGGCPHDEIMKLYQSNPYHLLISLSTSEGLPVSMMEAMSFGVPVLSTDVGGVSEIVKSETGLLIDLELPIHEVAALIDGLIESEFISEDFRKGVREYWQENFSADKNYPEFIARLLELTS